MARSRRDARALVLDGHSRAAVEVVQSLGARGVAVDVAAEPSDAIGFSSKYPRQRFAQPADTALLAEWLVERARDEGYALVVPSTENSLQAFRLLGDRHPLWRKALLPSQASLETALSKESTLSVAAAAGVPIPQSRLLEQGETAPAGDRFPVVLKPVRSVVTVDGRAVRLEPVVVRDDAERSRNLKRLLSVTGVQEQQYVGGRGVGVECLYQNGQMVWHFVHERVHELPLTGGGSTYRKSAYPEVGIVLAAKALLDALRWHGVAMVEFKRADSGDFRLMEINPRLWGSLALAIDAGVDFPWGMWLIANRHPPGPQPRYRVPYYSRYLPGDVDWMKENAKADRADVLLMTRPVAASVLEYLRPLAGRESWDHFRWGDPWVCLRQLGQIATANLTSVARLLSRRLLRARLLRQHARIERALRGKGAPSNVVFVCYGNICRSPFAGLYAARRMPAGSVRSAGFHREENRSSPDHLVLAARDWGIDLSEHRSRRLESEIVESAELIVVMDLTNFEALERAYPAAAAKAVCLGLFAEGAPLEIEDPYLLSLERTKLVLGQISSGIEGLFRLFGGGSQPERR